VSPGPPRPVTATGRRLIVHADDLGLSQGVNTGIALAHSEGIVTSASMMAVGAEFEHATRLCIALPSLDLGVHLTLIEERPLLPSSEVPTLVDHNGRFYADATMFIRRYFGGNIAMEDVRRELDAQIRRVRDAGIPVSHLDSHQHVHVLPRVFDVTVELAKEHGIPAIRVPRERISLAALAKAPSALRLVQQAVLNGFCIRAARRTRGLLRTDHFAGFLFGGRMNKDNLGHVLRNLPAEGCAELMCHPALPDPDSRYAYWGYEGPDELEALRDPSLPEHLGALGISLVSYRDLIIETGGPRNLYNSTDPPCASTPL
jgi:chitin disaccharide deacetylase